MNKKIISILLILTLVFAFTACDGIGGNGDGDYISYITKNNLSTKTYEPETLQKGKKAKDHYYSLQLSGLLDEGVQTDIDEEITVAVKELKESEVPLYEGLDKDINGKPTGVTITSSAKGSFNNILSVLLTKTVYYKDLTWTDTKTLNFDLRDGSLISFEDMFCKENTPGEALAEVCITYLEENKLLINGESPEFTEDQKYYLDLDGIHVIYDYATGGVKTDNYKPVEAVIPYNSVCESIDIKKYLTDKPLFEDSDVHNLLLPSGSELEESENNIPDQTNLGMIQYLSWPVDIPDKVLKAFMADAEVSDDDIESISNIAKMGSGVYYYNDMANCKQVGNYYNIVRSKSIFGSGIWTEDKYCSVYDKNGKEVLLGDLFVEGTEYKKIIIEALKKSLANYYEDNTYAGKTLDEVYDGLSFYLDTSGISLWTEGLGLKNKNGDKHESSVNFFIEYDKFGCQNMAIFN